jgi:hypothetical protein
MMPDRFGDWAKIVPVMSRNNKVLNACVIGYEKLGKKFKKQFYKYSDEFYLKKADFDEHKPVKYWYLG